MLATMYMGVAITQTLISNPWATFSANGILVLGGPEIQVWWVKFRTRVLEVGTNKALDAAAIIFSTFQENLNRTLVLFGGQNWITKMSANVM